MEQEREPHKFLQKFTLAETSCLHLLRIFRLLTVENIVAIAVGIAVDCRSGMLTGNEVSCLYFHHNSLVFSPHFSPLLSTILIEGGSESKN